MNAPVSPVVSPAVARDRGASLIIAIAFVVMIGAIGAGLTSLVTSGVGNRIALEAIRDRQYAADGAVEEAIAATSVGIAAGSITCGDESSDSVSLNDVAIRVDRLVTCGAAQDASGLPIVQLAGVFSACEDANVACSDETVIVRALIGFEQAPEGELVRTIVRSWSVLR